MNREQCVLFVAEYITFVTNSFNAHQLFVMEKISYVFINHERTATSYQKLALTPKSAQCP